jgi:hypothetical protein
MQYNQQQTTFARWHDDNSVEIAYLCEKFDWNKQSVLNHLFSLYRDGEISLDGAMSYLYKRDSVETALLSKQRDALTNRLKGYYKSFEDMADLLKGLISEVDEAELEAEPEPSLDSEPILDQQVYCYVDSETHSKLKHIAKRICATRDQVKGRDRITTSSLLRALIPLLDTIHIPDGEIQSNADLEEYIYDHFVTSVTE